MKKRMFSTVLAAVMLACLVMTNLSGCKAVDNGDYYSVTQWLDMVENSFNLLYYTQEEPLVTSVKTSDERFDTVQIAAEWGLIDISDDLKFNGKVTKEFAADTLIRAMNCTQSSTVDFTDSAKVKPLYLDNVMTSVNEGIFTLDGQKFDPKKVLGKTEADIALLTAYDKWINFSYGGESYDKSIVKDNVINYGGVTSENSVVVESNYKVEYTGSWTFFDENGGYTDNTEKTITFPAGDVPASLEVGTVLAMPADDVVPMNYAVVVTGITENGDGSVTVATRKAELEEVYEEIDVQQSGPVDFSQAVFYGPDGQRIEFEDEVAPLFADSTGESAPLGIYRSGQAGDLQKTAKKHSKTVDIGDNLSMTLSYSLDSGKGGIGVKIKGKVDGSNGQSTSVEFGFDENVSVENKLKTHWDWFKLKIDELRFSLTDKKQETFGFSHSAVEHPGSIQNNVKQRGDSWSIGDWATEGHKLGRIYDDLQLTGKSFKELSKKAKDATNKKLLDIIIPNTNLHFVIRAELSVDGSLKLTLTQSSTAGVELVSGKIRPISDKSSTQKLDFSAKIEMALRLALEFQLVGINVVDLGVKAGVGVKTGSVIYSFDKGTNSLEEVCGIEGVAVLPGKPVNAGDDIQIVENGLPVQTDDTREERICVEFSLYPIGSVYACSSSSVAGKVFSPIELTLWGEDTPFFKSHYEIDDNGGGAVSECTVTANDSFGIETGDKLTMNLEEHSIPVSEEGDTTLAVATIPKKTTIKDISIVSDNTDILVVENLLQSVVATATPAVKPKLTVGGNAISKKFMSGDVASYDFTTGTIQFGTWFYNKPSKDKKPQFVLVGKKNGMANVTITAGGQSVKVPIQVGTGVEAVESLGALISDVSTFTIAPGESVQTSFSYIPEGKTAADITYSTADSNIATVDKSGVITAVGEGSTFITAILEGEKGRYESTFTIHVYADS